MRMHSAGGTWADSNCSIKSAAAFSVTHALALCLHLGVLCAATCLALTSACRALLRSTTVQEREQSSVKRALQFEMRNCSPDGQGTIGRYVPEGECCRNPKLHGRSCNMPCLGSLTPWCSTQRVDWASSTWASFSSEDSCALPGRRSPPADISSSAALLDSG